METVLVCQLDDDGYFVGLVEAEESPLEPGVYLIPRGAVDAAPPIPPDPEMRSRWTSAGWVFENPPAPPEPEPVEPVDPVSICTRAQGILALHYMGLLNQISALVDQADIETQLRWEAASEWRSDNPTLLALGAQLELSAAEIYDLIAWAASIEV